MRADIGPKCAACNGRDRLHSCDNCGEWVCSHCVTIDGAGNLCPTCRADITIVGPRMAGHMVVEFGQLTPGIHGLDRDAQDLVFAIMLWAERKGVMSMALMQGALNRYAKEAGLPATYTIKEVKHG